MSVQVVVFAPSTNSPGKKDADYFRKQAQAFLKFCKQAYGYEGALEVFDNTQKLSQRAKWCLSRLATYKKLKVVGFFCHGWYNKKFKPKVVISSGMQAGFTLLNVDDLADAIWASADGQYINVPLYCCSDGDGTQTDPDTAMGGDGGFADVLRDELCVSGIIYCSLIAHATTGDCVYNAFVRRFNGDGSPTGGHGGSWIVAPTSKPCFLKSWTPWLKKNDNRFRQAFETTANIHDELGC